MVLRDRNHPSIIVWGIGNEIPEAWTKDGAPIAQKLAARIRSIDSTRPLTEAFPGATYTPATDAVFAQLDIGGYNYNLAQNQAKDHLRVPGRIMMTTESMPAAAFENWQLVKDQPYIVGEFVWTAMDYLGESGIGAWSYATPQEAAQAAGIAKMMQQMMSSMGADGKNPFEAMAAANDKPNPIAKLLFAGYPWHAAYSGDLDLTGFRKPSSYYRDILWNGGDRVFATVRLSEPEGKKIVAMGWSVYPTLPSWTWPGQEGKSLTVDVYSGAESVRLYLNDKLIGEKPTGRDQAFKAEFEVPYAPGTLKAEGVRAGKVVADSILQTTNDAARLKLTTDRTEISADGQDLAFVTVEAVDDKGRVQLNSDQKVHFAVSGAGSIAAVGNGNGQSLDPYSGDKCSLFHGRALVILRTTREAGEIKLSANGEGLPVSTVVVESKPARSLPDLQ
jgi:beta-galactosidase